MVNFKGVCGLIEFKKGDSEIRIVKNLDEPKPFENAREYGMEHLLQVT